jgi:hypothetical protein
MAAKPKARRPAGKAKKPKEDQKAQSERFIEAARAISVDETGREFEKALINILPKRKR